MKIINLLEDYRFDPMINEHVRCTECNHQYTIKMHQRDLMKKLECEQCERMFTHFKFLF